ncbi:hypothetical protein PI124_g21046 [Phytophthora idaei]|nr:hypothetical protein PI125_g22397 [Phytophthora idaei]KAG3130230.1 hypothetical protein PI126_g20600 [Phytophthora idaei]KAG3233887.1 hypothetical protein PI124_g21046 [Phytophthora idaei]
MGHVDGLSRLETGQVNSLRMADLLNSVEPVDVAPDLVGQLSEPLVEYEPSGEPEMQRYDAAEKKKEVEIADEGPVPPVDEFRLDVELFKAEQQEVSWAKALVAFL